MKNNSKNILLLLLSVIVSVLLVACSGDNSTDSEETLPSGDIEHIVPVASGGGTDLVNRAIAEGVEDILDKNVVITNIPGAGAAVGYGEAASRPADGLHVTSYTAGVFTLPSLQDVAFEPDDFKPIIMMNEDPAAIVVAADSEYETLEDFIEAAEESPGNISMGNSGHGNIWHLSGLALEKETGIEFNPVPFDGSSETVQALLGGHIDAFIASPPEVAGQVESGQLKILGVMSNERVETFPDVPTFEELGLEVNMSVWRGVAVPSDTDEALVEILTQAYSEAAQSDDFKEFMDERGMNINFLAGEDLDNFIEEEEAYFNELTSELTNSD